MPLRFPGPDGGRALTLLSRVQRGSAVRPPNLSRLGQGNGTLTEFSRLLYTYVRGKNKIREYTQVSVYGRERERERKIWNFGAFVLHVYPWYMRVKVYKKQKAHEHESEDWRGEEKERERERDGLACGGDGGLGGHRWAEGCWRARGWRWRWRRRR